MEKNHEMNAERELVARARAGDQDACSAIFRTNHDRSYRLCCQILPGPQDAEDLTQEAFLTALGKLDQFRGFTTIHLDSSHRNQCLPDAAPQEKRGGL